MFLQNHNLRIITGLIIIIVSAKFASGSQLQAEQVSRWTKELGNELWNLGRTITKFSEIQGSYGFLNAQVEKKDPANLLREIVMDIERMMDRKMDAIMRISEAAEEAAEEFEFNHTMSYEYYSSKYSNVEGEKNITLPASLEKNADMYLQMSLNHDTHFYNLAVNTAHSSVHVPINIYDNDNKTAFAIQWSEVLDTIFVKNYQSDPALFWQYFGSSSGILRHYPAKPWVKSEQETKTDLYDCRVRTWYIEAATCSKDVVILIDNSGSMDGMGKHIAAITTYNILDTFSNNDYINVLYYNTTTNYTIECFSDTLVQATSENIKHFRNAIYNLQPTGKTQLSQALETAFDLLKKYRDIRGCNESSNITCNQAIMVITDGISKNLSETVIKHNWFDNGSTIPVRIFTFLLGKEITNVNEILWLACANRGYHTHVQSLEQITESVLKYINVVARPLVLQAKEHPVSWTHAYIDQTYDDDSDDQINQPYRLLTSVAVPAFDRKGNKNNVTRVANLLGVAGTDVPIDEIEKLTTPYKIGVNAYSFIVSNNGYVLMHPNLRPFFKKKMTPNYNSIDLTEVEQLDDNRPPRDISETLENLRFSLVDAKTGSIHNVPVIYYYDDMRRVTREHYDYYFAPLQQTPFSIAIAIPDGYGNYSLDVGDEIFKNRHTGAKITDFFKGENWKIHPTWIYCKYHYIEGHEFKTPEFELLHFLGKMYDEGFVWEKQYKAHVDEHGIEDLEAVENWGQTHGVDDYYCDRQLVQRLVFDAKNTQGVFTGHWVFQSETGELPLFERYNATLRFVATMSGLTRWEYIKEEVENNTKQEFGDSHSKAIDETWYQSAVIQRQYDRESFVYSVPFDSGHDQDLQVTGSYAIFPNDAGLEAPGSVVGFQFGHRSLKSRVRQLWGKVSNQCPECSHCENLLSCYIIDNNGYIIVSENDKDTGKFFGEIEGDVMDSMLDEEIFENVTVYDFQVLCTKDEFKDISAGNRILNPLVSLVEWFFLKITWLTVEFNIHAQWAQLLSWAQELSSSTERSSEHYMETTSKMDTDTNDDSPEEMVEEDDEDEEWVGCEKERSLFILRQQLFLHDNYPTEITTPMSRYYYLKKVPFSNLLFVAINSTMPLNNPVKYTTEPRLIKYEGSDTNTYVCQKIQQNNFYRRKLQGCFDEDILEKDIKECGRGSVKVHSVLLNLMLLICTYYV